MTFPDSVGASASARELGGVELAARDPDVPLPPASNTKLLTAALAFHHLGSDYRFKTSVSRADDSFVLAGRGNPSLSPDHLSVLAEGVGNAGIDAVTTLVADAGWFTGPSRGPGWTWEDGKYGYGAESTALTLAGNTVSVTVSGTDIEVTPKTDAVELVADFDQSEDDLRVYRDSPEGTIRVEGRPPDEPQTDAVPVADPVRHCLLAFRDALADADVTVSGDLRIADDAETSDTAGETIATAKSLPVSKLVREMNVPSDNFLAEQFARTVAREVRGEGSWEAWEEVVGDFLAEREAGGFRIRDGSGLSRYNLISSRGLVGVLDWVAEQPWSTTFFDSLPAPGEGTLEDRLLALDCEVRAKTGTLTGSRTLSGILRRDEKRDVAFSVLLGGLTGEDEENAREMIDEFVRELAD